PDLSPARVRGSGGAVPATIYAGVVSARVAVDPDGLVVYVDDCSVRDSQLGHGNRRNDIVDVATQRRRNVTIDLRLLRLIRLDRDRLKAGARQGRREEAGISSAPDVEPIARLD